MSKPQSSCVHIFVNIKRLNKLADIMQIKFSHFTLHIILAISSSAATLLMVYIRGYIVTKNECAHLRCSLANIRQVYWQELAQFLFCTYEVLSSFFAYIIRLLAIVIYLTTQKLKCLNLYYKVIRLFVLKGVSNLTSNWVFYLGLLYIVLEWFQAIFITFLSKMLESIYMKQTCF